MSYGALTVVLQLGRSNAAALAVAGDLARRMSFSVTGVARAQPLAVLMGDDFFTGDVVRADEAAIAEQAKTAETEFCAALGDRSTRVQWDMAVSSAPPSESIATMAVAADLLVTGIVRTSDKFSDSTRRVDVANLVEMAGRPVFVVPPEHKHFGFRCALVAWKETREARRVLADALPLLRLMKKVVVAAVAETADRAGTRADLDKLLFWLGQHGVDAVSRLDLAGGDAGRRLLALAEEEGAELIVAGAYGHTRYQEWVMGGVTRTLLDESPCCLLLSH